MSRRSALLALVVGVLFVAPWPADAQSSQVQIVDDAFLPSNVKVDLGGEVTWTNIGERPHTVTSDGVFDSSPNCLAGLNCMEKGDQFSVRFDAAGTYPYQCKVHGDAMSGTVIVESGPTTTSSSTTITTTTLAGSTTTTATTTTLGEQLPSSQAPLPSNNTPSKTALPKSVIREDGNDADDLRPWVLLDIAIAGSTAIAGVVLVRRGRVPLG